MSFTFHQRILDGLLFQKSALSAAKRPLHHAEEGVPAPSFSRIPGAGRRRLGKGTLKKEAEARAGRIQVEVLSPYDLLFPENLSKQDIQKIKQVAVDFPQKVKARISELDRWTDKQKQKPRLTIPIRDML